MLAPVNSQGYIDFNTAPFHFDIVVEKLPKKSNGHQKIKPTGVTIHHSAITNSPLTDPLSIMTAYANHHMNVNGGIAYTIGIYKYDDNKIYISRYFDFCQWHNGNLALNKQTVGVLVDGNFETETLDANSLQLKKLRFLLDVLSTNSFTKNGWSDALSLINPRNFEQKLSGQGITVPSLHWHNEAAIPSAKTACCGKNLIRYIADYREKRGDVDWGVWWDTKQTSTVSEKLMVTIEQSEYERMNKELSELSNIKTLLEAKQKSYAESQAELSQAKEALQKIESDLLAVIEERDGLKTRIVNIINKYKANEKDIIAKIDKYKANEKIYMAKIEEYEANEKDYLEKIDELKTKLEARQNEIIISSGNTFWHWFNDLGRQIRYFLTNFFWGFIVIFLGVIIQLGAPDTEISKQISQKYPEIATILLLFFSNSFVQAFFKDQQEKAKKKVRLIEGDIVEQSN